MKTPFLIALLLLITGAAFGQEMIGFSGVVKNSQTGNLLEDINVFIEAKNTGTFTNHTGSFFMFLPAGIYDVTFSGDGYKPEKITFDLRKEKEAEIVLTPIATKRKAEAWLKKKHT
ncbi:MAG TPA: carboxypeptidase-like regulatory domain-containing protein, partial [Prolixibacteraceae bacterium]|nr:carboxypeptidase-like regulatory domain-containing protein [Prolixibacteraceae bacterium]